MSNSVGHCGDVYVFNTAKPIMISKHMYDVVLTPYLPYAALGAKSITLIYEFRFIQIAFFCFVQYFQLLMLNYHIKFAVIIIKKSIVFPKGNLTGKGYHAINTICTSFIMRPR